MSLATLQGETPSPQVPPPSLPCGAGGNRTPDLRLAKALLYQLSYSPMFSKRHIPDSNREPFPRQGTALTVELMRQASRSRYPLRNNGSGTLAGW
jgi:hypothetical protein